MLKTNRSRDGRLITKQAAFWVLIRGENSEDERLSVVMEQESDSEYIVAYTQAKAHRGPSEFVEPAVAPGKQLMVKKPCYFSAEQMEIAKVADFKSAAGRCPPSFFIALEKLVLQSRILLAKRAKRPSLVSAGASPASGASAGATPPTGTSGGAPGPVVVRGTDPNDPRK